MIPLTLCTNKRSRAWMAVMYCMLNYAAPVIAV